MDERAIDVSVIVTTFNVERYVKRAIDSALMQTGVTLEVIVIDDCSTDGTWEIVCGIHDSRVKRLRLEENGGPSVARNLGIAMAQGTWLAILDGDDAFVQGRLRRCLNRARALSAAVVVDNIRVEREADGKSFIMFPSSRFFTHPKLDLTRFIDGNRRFGGAYSLGYLKPVFLADFLATHKLGYDRDLRIGEDYLFLAEVLARGAVCAMEPKPGYLYTVRAGSISHRLTVADINRMLAADKKFLRRHRLSQQAIKAQKRRTRSLLEARAFTVLVTAIKQKDLVTALKTALTSPRALFYLWRPLWARLRRLGKRG